MNILLLNQNWFRNELTDLGHQVVSAGFREELDVQIEHSLQPITATLSALPGGFRPDVVIWLDDSMPPRHAAFEDLEIPLIFYSVDVHHHTLSHRRFAGIADHTFVAQLDYISDFESLGYQADWLPLWGTKLWGTKFGGAGLTQADSPRNGEAVFVGTLDPSLNPARVQFFEQLQKLVPLKVTQGEWVETYSNASVVINQSISQELNFRVFEAMACGALVLTEAIGNGLTELFSPGEHLLTYQPGNVEQAAQLIRQALDNPESSRAIAMAGFQEVLANHTARARAETLCDVASTLKKKEKDSKCFTAMAYYIELAAATKGVCHNSALKALGCAAQSAIKGLQASESLTEDLAASASKLSQYLRDLGEVKTAESLYALFASTYKSAGFFKDSKSQSS